MATNVLPVQDVFLGDLQHHQPDRCRRCLSDDFAVDSDLSPVSWLVTRPCFVVEHRPSPPIERHKVDYTFVELSLRVVRHRILAVDALRLESRRNQRMCEAANHDIHGRLTSACFHPRADLMHGRESLDFSLVRGKRGVGKKSMHEIAVLSPARRSAGSSGAGIQTLDFNFGVRDPFGQDVDLCDPARAELRPHPVRQPFISRRPPLVVSLLRCLQRKTTPTRATRK